MKKATIWHNPRCSKSRQTLALLESVADENDVEVEIVKYLDEVPSEKEIKTVLKKLKLDLSDLVRKKEKVFKELSLKGSDDETLLKAMVENPKLIERPVVIFGKKAIIGRPPENVHQLFEKAGKS